MKDLDERLQAQAGREPKRDLSANFTARIVSELKASPRPEKTTKNPFRILMNAPKQVAVPLVALLVIFLVAGTTYAAPAVISFFNAFLRSETVLKDGSRVIAIDMKNCSASTNYGDTTDGTYYYKINKDAPISNYDVTQMVQAECELMTMKSYVAVPQQYTGDYDVKEGEVNVRTTDIDTEVAAVSDESIMVIEKQQLQSRSPDGGIDYYFNKTRTFGTISPDVQVYSSDGKHEKLPDVSVGDHVQLTFLTTSPPSASLPTDDQHATVIGIQKTSVNVTKARGFAAYLNYYFTRVKPCTKDPSGYCTSKQASLLEGPKDYKKYVLKSDAINALSKVVDQYLSKKHLTDDEIDSIFAPSLKSELKGDMNKTLTCLGYTPTRLNYGDIGFDKDGNLLLSADTYSTYLDMNKPSVVFTYNPKQAKVVATSCIGSQDKQFSLIDASKQ